MNYWKSYLSKGNDYYSNKICSIGDMSAVIYFPKFGRGKDLQNSILLKEQLEKKTNKQLKPQFLFQNSEIYLPNPFEVHIVALEIK